MGGSFFGIEEGRDHVDAVRPGGDGSWADREPVPELPIGPLEEGLRAGGWRRAMALLGHPTVPFCSAFRGPER